MRAVQNIIYFQLINNYFCSIEIEALKAELAEGTEQVRWLKERSDEIEFQKREASNTITTAERVLRMKQTSTRSEVFRLKGKAAHPISPKRLSLFFSLLSDELEALEDLHMCHIVKVSADLFEYTYSSLFLVSIPCKNFMPIVAKVNITRLGKLNTRYKDDFPKLSAFLLAAARELIAQGDDMTVREVRCSPLLAVQPQHSLLTACICPCRSCTA